MAGTSDVGVLRRLVGVADDRLLDGIEQSLAFDDPLAAAKGFEKRLGEHRMPAAARTRHRLQPARDQRGPRTLAE